MIAALSRELQLRKDEFKDQTVTCIYFGGGTPSVLNTEELQKLIAVVYDNYKVSTAPEITLEANPDDLSIEKLNQLAASSINRLSIGVQSFFEEDLKLMNRAHNDQEAINAIVYAKQLFENISVDLIYGIPGMSLQRWNKNIDKILDFNIPHVSAYALTVEPKTALEAFIKKGTIKPVDDTIAQQHHEILVLRLASAGYQNYEFSNFGKPNYHSRNNTAYWESQSYIGIGPGAHSFDGNKRSWNISNNPKYIKSIQSNELPSTSELLTPTDLYNEYVMTRLRTAQGISIQYVQDNFGIQSHDYMLQHSLKHLENKVLVKESDRLYISAKGKFLTDGIAADLFLIN